MKTHKYSRQLHVHVHVYHSLSLLQFAFVHLCIQYGSESSSAYTPPTETVTVDVDGPAPADGCSDLTPSDTSCNFIITEDGTYTVTLITVNEVGPTINNMEFNCKLLK